MISKKKTRIELEESRAIRFVNDRLFLAERAFIKDTGITGPSGYLHVIYRPGRDDSYNSEAFSSIYESIASQDWDLVGNQITQVAQAIDSAGDILFPSFQL